MRNGEEWQWVCGSVAAETRGNPRRQDGGRFPPAGCAAPRKRLSAVQKILHIPVAARCGRGYNHRRAMSEMNNKAAQWPASERGSLGLVLYAAAHRHRRAAHRRHPALVAVARSAAAAWPVSRPGAGDPVRLRRCVDIDRSPPVPDRRAKMRADRRRHGGGRLRRPRAVALEEARRGRPARPHRARRHQPTPDRPAGYTLGMAEEAKHGLRSHTCPFGVQETMPATPVIGAHRRRPLLRGNRK